MTERGGPSRSELIERVRALEAQIASHTLITAAHKTERQHTQTALRDSEKRLRAILDTAVEGIITIDASGIIESFNAAAETIFGYTADEIIGSNVSLLMPRPHRQAHDTYIANYLRTGQARIIGIGREVMGQRKDRTIFPMDLSVSEVRLEKGVLFTGFVRDITERKRLEKEILEISDRERRSIGQGLHDGLCQHLAGIELMSQVLEQNLSRTSKSAAAQAGKIAQHVRDAISQTRSLARGLSPVSLESNGLMSALQELAETISSLFRVNCRFECPEPIHLADNAVATHVYRIAQEATSNAVKHGKADTILIRLRGKPGGVELAVSDDGIGFPKEKPDRGGMGLQIMKYRAGMIGATLEIRPTDGRGTVVICTFKDKA